jgi:hypothetical protein
MHKSKYTFKCNNQKNFCDPLLINLEGLYTPIGQCFTVKPGPIDKENLEKLEKEHCDETPVCDIGGEKLWGLVSTEYLQSLFERDKPLLSHDSNIKIRDRKYYVNGHVILNELLEQMRDLRAILLYRKLNETSHESIEKPFGLLTISDLNRHPVRATLYSLLATLESSLAYLVEEWTTDLDPYSWIKKLNEENQVQILGYWALSKKRDVDVGPIAATTLSQLINIVSRNKDFLSKLGYKSRTEFENHTGKIPSLRNCIMHPVRPLILDQHYVEDVSDTIKSIIDLRDRIEKAPRR